MQSGVMMLEPLNTTAFNELIVAPVRSGQVHSYDSGDQGIINTLMYERRFFGDAYMRLHPMYNVIARHAKHTELKWGAGTALSAALLHFTRETRPWQGPPQHNNVTRVAEWTTYCGPVVCKSMAVRRKIKPNVSYAFNIGGNAGTANATNKPPKSQPKAIGVHEYWDDYCRDHPYRSPNGNATGMHGGGKRNASHSAHGGGKRNATHAALRVLERVIAAD